MIRTLFLLILICFSTSQAFAQISGKLMQFAASHQGHKDLENHDFITGLRNKQIRREQIAQFLHDRVYFLQIIEELTLPFKNNELYLVTPSEKIFYRSKVYQDELNLLLGKHITVGESNAAVRYAEYLRNAKEDVRAVHLWTFLIGETFGAIHIGDYIQSKYKNVGKVSKNFEGLKLLTVRGIYNEWINTKLRDSSVDYESEITYAFQAFNEMFTQANEVPKVHFCQSLMTFLSEQCFLRIGY